MVLFLRIFEMATDRFSKVQPLNDYTNQIGTNSLTFLTKAIKPCFGKCSISQFIKEKSIYHGFKFEILAFSALMHNT